MLNLFSFPQLQDIKKNEKKTHKKTHKVSYFMIYIKAITKCKDERIVTAVLNIINFKGQSNDLL